MVSSRSANEFKDNIWTIEEDDWPVLVKLCARLGAQLRPSTSALARWASRAEAEAQSVIPAKRRKKTWLVRRDAEASLR